MERYCTRLSKEAFKAKTTLKKKSLNICKALNYFLHNTRKNKICELDIDDIRGFLKSVTEEKVNRKKVVDGKNYELSKQQETVDGIKRDVWRFLKEYYCENKDNQEFNYTPDDLIEEFIGKDQYGNSTRVEEFNNLNIKKSSGHIRKNRILMKDYFNMLVYEAQVYDPEMVFAIDCGGYAGLREGENVNLTRTSISFESVAFAAGSNILIDLTHDAPFFEPGTFKGKTPPGSIKKKRPQYVHNTFCERFVQDYKMHEAIMAKKWKEYGYTDPNQTPLFLNENGKPLTVSAYCERVRKLFYNHFLPDLIKYVEFNGTWSEDGPNIEAYADEYPGAHMFRHWFTSYLREVEHLEDNLVAEARGDKDCFSLDRYTHRFSNSIEDFKNSTFVFQEQVLLNAQRLYSGN